MSDLIRKCPKCDSERLPTEVRCENVIDNVVCGWMLFNEPLVNPAAVDVSVSASGPGVTASKSAQKQRTCIEGHPVPDGDIICFVCGGDIAVAEPPQSEQGFVGEVISGWLLEEQMFVDSPSEDYFLVRESSGDKQAFMVLYKESFEPDTAVYQALERMDSDHRPDLILTGRWHNRPYEIHEWISEGALADKEYTGPDDIDEVKAIVFEIGKALRDFSHIGLRHRDVNPNTILLREKDPLDLVITDFGSARLSDFDLDIASPLTLTKYSAPEAIIGAVSPASDWWSLGMIVFEQVTYGKCFEDVDEKAFLIHVVTRGVDLPNDLTPMVANLLTGLLAKDPMQRWGWEEVERWLDGELVALPQQSGMADVDLSKPIALSGKTYFSPERFSLAAAEASNWDEARELFARGELFTWLNEQAFDSKNLALLNRIKTRNDIELDHKLSLALMLLNSALPLTCRGQIINPAWLTQNVDEACQLLEGPLPELLEEMSRETWLVLLTQRRINTLDRARLLEIELDEFLLRQYSIVCSRAQLDAEERLLRAAFPDTGHAGLSSLMVKPRLNDEDLLVLLSATRNQLTPLSMVIDEAEKVAGLLEIDSFDKTKSIELLREDRRKIYRLLDERIKDFSRCGIARIDSWADEFRIDRRISLQRIVVLLSVEPSLWVPPEKQRYKENIIQFFEKRVANAILRGPLVRLIVSATGSKIDLREMALSKAKAESILNHVLDRSGASFPLDPQVLVADTVANVPFQSRMSTLERRLRRLISDAESYRRDTGIAPMYLGYPFVTIHNPSFLNARPRIAPLLVWPVKVAIAPSYSICFDKEREEVRLNPALEGLLGSVEFEQYQSLVRELLSRPSIRMSDCMEVLAAVVEEVELVAHPRANFQVAPGHVEVISSAVVFNARFVGQAIGEDLRQLKQLPVNNTALASLLKMELAEEAEEMNGGAEKALFNVARSDPSQDAAIAAARKHPGVVVEGPPGTGKSQTIVNVVADCVGRGETVLIVCQKQAALDVVRKRLEAENLGQRLCGVVDINRDRQPIIRQVRAQVEEIFRTPSSGLSAVHSKRQELVERIGLLDKKINEVEQSTRRHSDRYGVSYRELISRLISLEEGDQNGLVDVPELRNLLLPLNDEALYAVQQRCATLSSSWLASNYEDSPFLELKQFSADASVVGSLKSKLEEFYEKEQARTKVLLECSDDFDTDDSSGYLEWVDASKTIINNLETEDLENFSSWADLCFDAALTPVTVGAELLKDLQVLRDDLALINTENHDPIFFELLSQLPSRTLAKLSKYCKSALAEKSMFSKINIFRMYRESRIRRCIENLEGIYSDERVPALQRAVEFEIRIRPLRMRALRLLPNLGYERKDISLLNVSGLRFRLLKAIGQLQVMLDVATLVLACPRQADAIKLFRNISTLTVAKFYENFTDAIARSTQRNLCIEAIDSLCEWFEPEWLVKKKQDIRDNQSISHEVRSMLDSIATVAPLQVFRAASADADSMTFEVLARLRKCEAALKTALSLEECVLNSIRREAYLAWKNDIEQNNPSIMLGKDSFQRLVSDLEIARTELLKTNKRVLGSKVEEKLIGSRAAWESITRLRGPRSKKLREFLGSGEEIGLMHLRPIWLMSPEVVSEVLPLQAKLFDVVIFDEASQLLVDHAIPSLFRAGRAIISGDEKQMPPSSSFLKKMDFDDDEYLEELEDDMSEAEAAAIEDKWNQREIKDCPDLLALGKTILPANTLEIHYRSEYNALIEFSNHAFYAGKLNVPAKHSAAEIQKIQPVEVRRIDGIYSEQANLSEAQGVLEVLKEIWLKADNRQSVGVVTFNLKQAELVEELIQLEAKENPEFADAYARELSRIQGGEDMGFFVKNVENVQGDERDIILFSTTFGYNAHGAFRRNFGALGQRGGERRLNVAITRARNKVIILTSMPIEKISDFLDVGRSPNKPRDYLQAYLDFATKKSEGHIELARRAAKLLSANKVGDHENSNANDAFVNSVKQVIVQFGFKVVSVNEGDAFDLDLAVENPETGLFSLGIECDAPYHHLLESAAAREIWRKNVLQRSVPKLHRISCFDWYHNRAEEERNLRNAIQESLGIHKVVNA